MFKNLTSSGNIECPIARECGGCSQIQVPYEEQLATKQVYISCTFETQVRDCQVLRGAGYVLQAVQPVDMFPHTTHVETVVRLTRM